MPRRRQIIQAGGKPTKTVTAPVIVTPNGEEIVHEDADIVGAHEIAGGVRKIIEKTGGAYVEDALDQEAGVQDVTDQIVSGQVEANPTKQKNTQSVIDRIITGRAEATPTRDEGTTGVTGHVITGDVAVGATDNGALQSPGLPVKVSSGKLGPGAAYSAKNWGGEPVWAYGTQNDGAFTNSLSAQGEQAGDLLMIAGKYSSTDYNATLNFSNEINVNRLSYTYLKNPHGNNEAVFFGMWELTGGFDAVYDVQVTAGPTTEHDYASVVFRALSEFY